jgi:hypothetical protein
MTKYKPIGVCAAKVMEGAHELTQGGRQVERGIIAVALLHMYRQVKDEISVKQVEASSCGCFDIQSFDNSLAISPLRLCPLPYQEQPLSKQQR